MYIEDILDRDLIVSYINHYMNKPSFAKKVDEIKTLIAEIIDDVSLKGGIFRKLSTTSPNLQFSLPKYEGYDIYELADELGYGPEGEDELIEDYEIFIVETIHQVVTDRVKSML